MIRKILCGVLVSCLLALGVACGGASSQQATDFCDQERTALGKSGCFDDDVYNNCISCYESCGDNCRSNDLCPGMQFACMN